MINPEQQQVEQGEAFAVDIELRNFPMTQGGGFSLLFDPGILRATGMSFSGAWNFASRPGTILNDSGVIRDVIFAAFPGVVGRRTPVATLWFEAIATGETRLRLARSTQNPFASAGHPVDAELVGAKVEIIRAHAGHHHDEEDGDDGDDGDEHEHDEGGVDD